MRMPRRTVRSRRGSNCLVGLLLLLASCSSAPETNSQEPVKAPADATAKAPTEAPASAPAAAVDTVEIKDMKFNPESITVSKGDMVVFVNHDMVAHCATGETGKPWTSSTIPAGGSYSLVVDESSNYHCAIHPVMKGKIIVKN